MQPLVAQLTFRLLPVTVFCWRRYSDQVLEAAPSQRRLSTLLRILSLHTISIVADQ